jgi:hypothetical protein
MAITIREISSQALSLPPKSRAILANMLLDSLEEVRVSDNEKKWIEEAKKRDKEITEGKVVCKSHDDVMKSAYKAIECKK